MLNFNPNQNVGYTQFPTFAPTPGPAFPGYLPAANGPAQIVQVLQQLMSSLSALAVGWTGVLGGQPPLYPGFPQQPPNPYNPFPQPGPYTPGPYQPAPQFPSYVPNQPSLWTGQTGPGFLGVPGQSMPFPTDPNDYASYLQAQRLGGSLQGKTGIAQSDAIPGTRFGSVQNPTGWQASVARNYAYQFAAYAMGQDPLSPQGMAYAAANWEQMSPDAKIFTQVASVFKGNLLGGPGNYDNPGLRNLLISRGFGNLIGPGVGETDVQTIGAVTQALNSGRLTLQDIIQSGTIDNLDRYFNIIGYVQNGGFNQDLRVYDTVGPGG